MTSKFRVRTTTSQPLYRRSRFLITVNSNTAFSDRTMLELSKQRLQDTLNDIFNHFEDYLLAYKKENGYHIPLMLSSKTISDHIKEADIESHLEIGSIKHRLHNHAIVDIQHDDMILRVNLRKLRSALPRGFHLDVKFIRSADFDLRKYVRKQNIT